MGSTASLRVMALLLVVLSTITLAGCQAIGDIFKAGVWVGVIGVIVVIGVIGFIIAKISG